MADTAEKDAAPVVHNIRFDFCGQQQPHGPHTWLTPPFSSTSTPSRRQCAGLARHLPPGVDHAGDAD